MEHPRYTFRVNTKMVKTTFVSVAVFVLVIFLIIFVVGSRDTSVGMFLGCALFALGLLAVLWIYGRWRVFGFEWRLYDDGLQILRESQEVRFLRWQDIAKIRKGGFVIVARDGSKFVITLPPPLQRTMRQRMLAIMRENDIALAV